MNAIAKGGPKPALTSDSRLAYAHDLSAWQVQTVIVGPMANQEQMVSFFSELLHRSPSQEGGVYVWLGLSNISWGGGGASNAG
jgi:hypothetical protein